MSLVPAQANGVVELQRLYLGNPYLAQAARAVVAGGVIGYPTEAVWGLGCDPLNEQAVQRVITLKRRIPEKGMIVIAHSWRTLQPALEDIDVDQLRAADAETNRPTTWLVPNNGYYSDWVTGGRPTLAVRVTQHPAAALLCARAGRPIVSTSANPASLAPARNRCKLLCYFAGELDAIAPGQVGRAARPSEIRDFVSGAVRRAG
ncbi:L-threonylcarbamoyladenylate synthase [Porticoccaceae bacterium]|nr:L-threonylcarbamoyladenylate synthase [Porticoccaceae bacterium]